MPENPKLFISYSWSSQEHQDWVIRLATELCENGVDVILDKWNLKEGQDAVAFMERMVTDPDIKKVIVVCDHVYAEKADKRSGGVGTETQIISPEIYSKVDQSKFVAVLSEKDESDKPYVPVYYKSRIFIDLSDTELYASNFEQLLRWVYDKPLYIKPELGKKPAFLSEEGTISLETTTRFRRAVDAIRNNKEYAPGALEEFLSTFATNLEKFRITDKEGEFDDKVVESIEKFLPFRNEAVEIFTVVARYKDTPETIVQLHRFFERLIPYLDKPEGVTSWKEWDFDNFRFIVHELFLYFVASLLKHERFNSLSKFLEQYYYVEGNSEYGRDAMVHFEKLREHIRSLQYRNKRLQLRRLSVHADLLKQRCNNPSITFRQLMQADFVLFIRDCFDSIKIGKDQGWWPYTLIYAERHSGPFEIFARAQSKEYFNRLKVIFGIEKKEDLVTIFEAFKGDKLRVPHWDFNSFSPATLMGLEKLATKP